MQWLRGYSWKLELRGGASRRGRIACLFAGLAAVLAFGAARLSPDEPAGALESGIAAARLAPAPGPRAPDRVFLGFAPAPQMSSVPSEDLSPLRLARDNAPLVVAAPTPQAHTPISIRPDPVQLRVALATPASGAAAEPARAASAALPPVLDSPFGLDPGQVVSQPSVKVRVVHSTSPRPAPTAIAGVDRESVRAERSAIARREAAAAPRPVAAGSPEWLLPREAIRVAWRHTTDELDTDRLGESSGDSKPPLVPLLQLPLTLALQRDSLAEGPAHPAGSDWQPDWKPGSTPLPIESALAAPIGWLVAFAPADVVPREAARTLGAERLAERAPLGLGRESDAERVLQLTPEPGTASLMVLGLAALGLRRRRA